MSTEMQRNALSQFLRRCRARISPADAGLPEPGRRRAIGLRREDMASLAGVSITWYTRLEQGQDITASAPLLERIASALKLSAVERDYLFELAHGRPAPLLAKREESPSPATLRMLASLPLPAYIKTVRWDIIAWNEMSKLVLPPLDPLAPCERNLLKILFSRQLGSAQDDDQFRMTARRVVGKLRMDYGRFSGDPEFESLIADLRETHAYFRDLWDHGQEIANQSDAIVFRQHPLVGKLSFAQSSYAPEGCLRFRLLIYAPHDAQTAGKLRQLHHSREHRPLEARRVRAV